MSVLSRIRKLIALAASDNEHEARNAAYLAVKLIRDHKVTLRLGDEDEEGEGTPSLEDMWNEIMRNRGGPPSPGFRRRPPVQQPLDDPTDEDAFFSRAPKRKPRKPDLTDEELRDIFEKGKKDG